MPSFNPILKRAYWVLVIAGSTWALLILALLNPWLQRHALYVHKIHTGFWHDLDSPESFGFAKNQVTAFNLSTSDGEKLYAWHVLPLGLYATHEEVLRGWPSTGPFEASPNFKLLRDDPQARLVINLHGNAGHVAQGYRAQTYRSLSGVSPDHLHILTLDYRGFGRSTGSPTEDGLILDGLAAVEWAITEAGIPLERIVLLGQSLGTAVAASVAERIACSAANKEVSRSSHSFAAVVLVAPFPSLPRLLETYRIGGIIPVLSPLRAYPQITSYLRRHIVDSWKTDERIKLLVKDDVNVNLVLMHSITDYEITWRYSEELFKVAREALPGGEIGDVVGQLDGRKGGKMVVEGQKGGKVTMEILEYGGELLFLEDIEVLFISWLKHCADRSTMAGHNPIVTHAPVALAVMRAFGLHKDIG